MQKLKKRLSLIEQTEKLEGELKSLSTSEDSLALKRSGELLSDDHDAPTSKKACDGSDKGFPRLPTSSPARPRQRTSQSPFSPVAASHPRQTRRSNEETVNVPEMQSGVQNKKAVDVSIKIKWP